MTQSITRLTIVFLLFFPIFVSAFHTGEPLVSCKGVGPNAEDVCTFQDLIDTANNVIEEVLFLAISLAAILFTWAGFLYVTSGGDQGKVAQAHEIFKNVAIGFLIALGAFLIVKAIIVGLGADIDPKFIFWES